MKKSIRPIVTLVLGLASSCGPQPQSAINAQTNGTKTIQQLAIDYARTEVSRHETLVDAFKKEILNVDNKVWKARFPYLANALVRDAAASLPQEAAFIEKLKQSLNECESVKPELSGLGNLCDSFDEMEKKWLQDFTWLRQIFWDLESESPYSATLEQRDDQLDDLLMRRIEIRKLERSKKKKAREL